MLIKDIKYLSPLSEIIDIENDNIDICVMLEDSTEYTVVVATPKNLIWYMNKENKGFIEASPPDIIVSSLTEENIWNAVKTYAEDDAYWLKLYFLAGYKKGALKTENLDKLVRIVRGE